MRRDSVPAYHHSYEYVRVAARSLVVLPLMLGMLLLCPVVALSPTWVAARPLLLTKTRAAAVALLMSPTSSINQAFLNYVFVRGIDEDTGVQLIDCLAKGAYHRAGDLMDANPDTIRTSMHNLGVVESHQDAICRWHTKQLQEAEQLQETERLQETDKLQARDRPLPGSTCTLDSRPGRQTPLS